jgi:SAM-dependent MidA family methyltransferase
MSRQTQAVKTVSQIIHAEAAASGVLSFARFMELALYCPVHGYYETQKDNVGPRGDFYTSVSTGELFGELLAFQFANWLETEARSQKLEVRIIEAGAHDGKLARDILSWLQSHRSELFGRLEYGIVEPSPHREEWQKETLKNFAPRVRWLSRFNDSTIQRSNGIIFSNELLDAMPVHRYGWDAKNKKWFEWGVAIEGEKFVWARMAGPLAPPNGERAGVRGSFEHSPSFIFHLPPALLDVLPDGYAIETSPAAENWWREAAGILAHGKLLAIDYGHGADELFSPARTRGTLRAYHRHHVSDDLLANVGEQDLTAHVNFSAIQEAGEAAGLVTESFTTQPQFLTQILDAALKDKSFGEWNARRTRQFQTLTHPEHLGRAFRVLVQSR